MFTSASRKSKQKCWTDLRTPKNDRGATTAFVAASSVRSTAGCSRQRLRGTLPEEGGGARVELSPSPFYEQLVSGTFRQTRLKSCNASVLEVSNEQGMQSYCTHLGFSHLQCKDASQDAVAVTSRSENSYKFLSRAPTHGARARVLKSKLASHSRDFHDLQAAGATIAGA